MGGKIVILSDADNPTYEEKFAGLLRLIADAKTSGINIVLIAYAQVLGDNYEELVESLGRIADAKLELAIAGRLPD